MAEKAAISPHFAVVQMFCNKGPQIHYVSHVIALDNKENVKGLVRRLPRYPSEIEMIVLG